MAMPRASRTIPRRGSTDPLGPPECAASRLTVCPERRRTAHSSPPTAARVLLRRDVGGSEPAVDQERRPADVARLIAREEKRRVGDLAGFGETTHRQVPPSALGGAPVFAAASHPQ